MKNKFYEHGFERLTFTRNTAILLLSIIVPLCIVLNGCGKKAPPPEPDYSELETTPALPASTNFTRYDAKPGGKVRIEGTSTMHDWQVEGRLIGGYIEISDDFPEKTEPDTSVQVRGEAFIPVRSLRSLTKEGNAYSSKMDDIMHEKLLAAEHPKIFFRIREVTVKSKPGTPDAAYVCEGKGDLVAAGVTNTISMPVNITILPDQRLQISATAETKMTMFRIKPPEPVGIVLKTGDEVRLIVNWLLAAQPSAQAGS